MRLSSPSSASQVGRCSRVAPSARGPRRGVLRAPPYFHRQRGGRGVAPVDRGEAAVTSGTTRTASRPRGEHALEVRLLIGLRRGRRGPAPPAGERALARRPRAAPLDRAVSHYAVPRPSATTRRMPRRTAEADPARGPARRGPARARRGIQAERGSPRSTAMPSVNQAASRARRPAPRPRRTPTRPAPDEASATASRGGSGSARSSTRTGARATRRERRQAGAIATSVPSRRQQDREWLQASVMPLGRSSGRRRGTRSGTKPPRSSRCRRRRAGLTNPA